MSFIIKRRCDEAMRRSKEKCRTPSGYKWKCTGECKTCICCIYMTQYFHERHYNRMRKLPED